MKVINYKNCAGNFIVNCYGVLTNESNIIVKTQDNEQVMENWNYDTNQPFKYWSEVVEYLADSDDYMELEELEVC